jgi:hypothetical protein
MDKAIQIRKEGEYTYESLQNKSLFRVGRGDKKTKWVAFKFLQGIFLADTNKFKQIINSKLQHEALSLCSKK